MLKFQFDHFYAISSILASSHFFSSPFWMSKQVFPLILLNQTGLTISSSYPIRVFGVFWHLKFSISKLRTNVQHRKFDNRFEIGFSKKISLVVEIGCNCWWSTSKSSKIRFKFLFATKFNLKMVWNPTNQELSTVDPRKLQLICPLADYHELRIRRK